MTGECDGKKEFQTYWQAVRAASRLNRSRDKAKANVYKCSRCAYFHVGNSLHSDTRKRK